MRLCNIIILIFIPYLLGDDKENTPAMTYQNGDSQVFIFDDLVSPNLGNALQQYLVRYVVFTKNSFFFTLMNIKNMTYLNKYGTPNKIFLQYLKIF